MANSLDAALAHKFPVVRIRRFSLWTRRGNWMKEGFSKLFSNAGFVRRGSIDQCGEYLSKTFFGGGGVGGD